MSAPDPADPKGAGIFPDPAAFAEALASPTDPATGPPPESDAGLLAALVEVLDSVVVGQRALNRMLVIALVAGGHVLVEGVPGLAKTRAVRALALALDLPFRRIQFTPDLLPADLTGTQIYRPASGTFETHPGPIITSVLLADEINRAPAKVQSALLEAMQEGQVTIADHTQILPDPFFVLATQNPIEHEGTYPLPEAQLDRFLLKLVVSYPDRASELAMLDLPDVITSQPLSERVQPVLGPSQVRALRARCALVHVAGPVREYAVDCVRATRDPEGYGLGLSPLIELGASPRATLALVRCAQARALLEGRDYVVPHDVKAVAPDVLRHRVLTSYEADAEGQTSDDLIGQILDRLRVP